MSLHRLSNGRYTVAMSEAGSGYSALEEIALTRWRADPIEDGDGFFVYVRDLDCGDHWSAGFQPLGRRPDRYGLRRDADAFEIERSDHEIETTLSVRVASDHNFELRRCTIGNGAAVPRHIEVTSYAEVVLAAQGADGAHPAFSKLFVQTEHVAEHRALLARRRPRAAGEKPLWLVHWLAMEGTEKGIVEHETDRMRFIGRGYTLARPRVLLERTPLSGTVGAVLDAIVSLRIALLLEPMSEKTVCFNLGAAPTREWALAWASCYGSLGSIAPLFKPAGGSPRARVCTQLSLSAEPDRYRPAAEATPPPAGSPPADEELIFDNGCGGFTADGREYVIRVGPSQRPPLPWVHIVANERFGFLVSEAGAGFTWSGNSREMRLTPWYNDPVCDPHGEAFYVRDEDGKEFWSLLAGPVAGDGHYRVHYGFGYSRVTHVRRGLSQEVLQFVPRRDPVKLTRIRLRNTTRERRLLSLYSYARLVLGGLPEETAELIETRYDEKAGISLAVNSSQTKRDRQEENALAGRVAFAAIAAPPGASHYFTADRQSFIGPYGSPARPQALRRFQILDGGAGAGLDPCFAWQIVVALEAGEEMSCVFLLGEAADEAAARRLAARYRIAETVEHSFDEVRAFWRDIHDGFTVQTPSPALDLMLNGWLVYQDLSCRLWGRSAFYQSGGAFGFRDQLQDAAALVYLQPGLTRTQILLHAAQQFAEGDVLHWWHPPEGRGIRTRFSDDLLWLPYLTAFYVATTGDRAVLDEPIPFLAAPALEPGADELYLLPGRSGETASLYEHCCRALDRSLTRGAHGLPLMGTGDWNDGMNRVGRGGRGESVWLGFFLYRTLLDFIPYCTEHGDGERLARYRDYAAGLVQALEKDGWDGAWYRRAYYDDGTALGSAENEECRIDALVQAWAAISGAGSLERRKKALDAVERYLVSEPEKIIRLLTPPFDNTPHDPGYIKGYVPGVRENGGQYTHAALWVVMAMTRCGRGERAAQLLEMLNPIQHARTPAEVAVYRVEPYVVAADVYGAEPHVGRGGWTWYTGSAGWFYRVAIEAILGFSVKDGRTLVLAPRIPASWPGFELRYRLPDRMTYYHITVVNEASARGVVASATLDGTVLIPEHGSLHVPLVNDGARHELHLSLRT